MVVLRPKTPGERRRMLSLLWAARAEFGRLDTPNQQVVRAAALGQMADFTDAAYDRKYDEAVEAEREATKDNKPLPSIDDRPTPPVAVRADLVRWLLIDAAAHPHVHATGINITAAGFNDQLDLQGCHVKHSLWFIRCNFERGVDLLDARCRTIGLYGCTVKQGPMDGGTIASVRADGMTTVGNVNLNNGFRAVGEVRLLGASITGDLNCSGGTFENDGGNALSADRLSTDGNVSLNDGFRAAGKVRLLGASITGDLDCSGGTFENADGHALSADGMTTGGDVFFDEGFRAAGGVRLLGATIDGNLSCMDGHFANDRGVALSANGAEVRGSFQIRGVACGGSITTIELCRTIKATA